MPTIQIREKSVTEHGFTVTIKIDELEYTATVQNPHNAPAEQELAWYFEQWLQLPMIEGERAKTAAESIRFYGEALFNQLFEERTVYAAYDLLKRTQSNEIQFEVVGDTMAFHEIHWEALKDFNMPQAWAVTAPFVRRKVKPSPMTFNTAVSPTLNVLVVTARPEGRRDVAYRTISRPLVDMLQNSDMKVNLDLVRPGTFRALCEHLEAKGPGYYHLLHLDVHGVNLEHAAANQNRVDLTRQTFQSQDFRYGRLAELLPFQGKRGFIVFENEDLAAETRADLVEAGELAVQVNRYQIPAVVLNACQSGKQEPGMEASLGAKLMLEGVQSVVAMAYSVTVSAAKLYMEQLYRALFTQTPFNKATTKARLALHNDTKRQAYFNQTIHLQDWLLPVIFQNKGFQFQARPLTLAEEEAYATQAAQQFRAPKPQYGFFGRDLDILALERRILQHNLLLLQGMGGAGKTTLLKHLAAWWQKTGFVEQVFYFGYDEKAYTTSQLLNLLGAQLFAPHVFEQKILAEPREAVKSALIVAQLRAKPHLLILDNLESIRGADLAIPNTLNPEEQEKLRLFLADLNGGQTQGAAGFAGRRGLVGTGNL